MFCGLLLGCLLFVVGCGDSSTKAISENQPTSDSSQTAFEAPESQPPVPDKSKQITVEVARFAQIEDEISKHRGKVVVVDYWSTW